MVENKTVEFRTSKGRIRKKRINYLNESIKMRVLHATESFVAYAVPNWSVLGAEHM